MLHQDGDAGRTAPLPGADGLPALVERFRSAGADVTLHRRRRHRPAAGHHRPGCLPHPAGGADQRDQARAGARTAVHLAVDADEVRLAVDTSGAPGTGTGLGVLSMRERAESLGGTCPAGPGGQGWLVQAAFPLDRSRRREDAR